MGNHTINPKMSMSGRLFIISAPSGTGKTTLCHAVLKRCPDLVYSISHTTRAPRGNEKDKRDYYFISQKEFIERIEKSQWAEWALVHGHYYGTSTLFLDHELKSGKKVLLDIDVQGTMKILEKYPDSITIFIKPPSMDVLKQRLEKRGTDTQAVIDIRIKNAIKEIESIGRYHFVIVNDRLDDAIDELTGLINKNN